LRRSGWSTLGIERLSVDVAVDFPEKTLSELSGVDVRRRQRGFVQRRARPRVVVLRRQHLRIERGFVPDQERKGR
jgi:hypothetical protein